MMKQRTTATALIIILALMPILGSSFFILDRTGKSGTKLVSTVCNIQTTLDFYFSPSTTLTGTDQTLANAGASTLTFLTAYGLDVVLPLTNAILAPSSNFAVGYGGRIAVDNINNPSITIQAQFVFKFSDGTNTVYVYIPVVTNNDAKNNPDFIDLQQVGEPLGSFSITSGSTSLNIFNMFNKNNYNQWYTAVTGTNTVLVSSFVYRIKSVGNKKTDTFVADMSGLPWPIETTGDKLCYASTITNGNFQTHLRESVPLWFVWFWIFFYWLFYLISESSTTAVYDRHYQNNKWTCVALYSLFNLAHEECFTRLSRSTVLFINWTIQGVFLASIYGNNVLGSPMVIWSAVIAFVATIPIPFILGVVFFKKIQEKNLIKYENMKTMKGTMDKTQIKPYEDAIQECEEKLYGYYHWFYSLAFILFFICWPIAINQMQKLSRVNYHYHWYWLASMGIVFALEYIIFEPLLALIFGNTEGMKKRGGHFYNFKLGEMYRAAQTY